MVLLKGAAPHRELLRRLPRLGESVLSRHLRDLRSVGLIEQAGNSRAPWRVRRPGETRALIGAAATIAASFGLSGSLSDQEIARAMRKSAMAQEAQEAEGTA